MFKKKGLLLICYVRVQLFTCCVSLIPGLLVCCVCCVLLCVFAGFPLVFEMYQTLKGSENLDPGFATLGAFASASKRDVCMQCCL